MESKRRNPQRGDGSKGIRSEPGFDCEGHPQAHLLKSVVKTAQLMRAPFVGYLFTTIKTDRKLRRASASALSRRQRRIKSRFWSNVIFILANLSSRAWHFKEFLFQSHLGHERGGRRRRRDDDLNLAPPSKPDRPISGILLSSRWVLVRDWIACARAMAKENNPADRGIALAAPCILTRPGVRTLGSSSVSSTSMRQAAKSSSSFPSMSDRGRFPAYLLQTLKEPFSWRRGFRPLSLSRSRSRL